MVGLVHAIFTSVLLFVVCLQSEDSGEYVVISLLPSFKLKQQASIDVSWTSRVIAPS